MNTNHFKKQIGGVLMILLCAAVQVYAGGGGGGGGGGGRGGGGGGGGAGGGFGGGGGAALGAVGGGGGGGGRGGGGGGGGGNTSYNGNGLVGTAQISVDPNTHNLIIIADPVTMEQIRQVLASLDAPEPQVNIKVCFLEVDDSAALDIGFEGNYNGASSAFGLISGYITNYTTYANSTTSQTTPPVTTTSASTIGPSTLTPLTTSYVVGQGFGLPASPAGAGGNGGVYQVMSTDFTATLQAIATKGKARVLSRPMIMARDGQLAEIVVGQSVYLPSSVTLTSVGGTGTTVPEVNGNYQNVGIQLDVTPFIGINGLITLILQPQITSIDTSTPGQVIQGGSLLSAAVYAPNLNKRSANTVVVTPDGRPVVIGGLMSSDKATSETKIPLLGDIPVLGNFFKFSSHSNAKNELLIFLTPHIIQSPEALPDMSTHEMAQMPMITNSVTSFELERVLDGMPVKK